MRFPARRPREKRRTYAGEAAQAEALRAVLNSQASRTGLTSAAPPALNKQLNVQPNNQPNKQLNVQLNNQPNKQLNVELNNQLNAQMNNQKIGG